MDPEVARVRMLRLWAAMGDSPGAPVSIVTTQHTVVQADMVVTNSKQTLLGATKLQTPLGTYPHAVLRDYEVASVEREMSIDQLRALLEL